MKSASHHPDGLSDPTLAALLAKAEEAQAEVRAYLIRCAAPPPPVARDRNHWPDDPCDPDLISTFEARKRAVRAKTTIETWCRLYGIGKMYGRRLRVSSWRLTEHLAKNS